MTIILRDSAGSDREIQRDRKTLAEVIIIGEGHSDTSDKYYVRQSVSEQRAIYTEATVERI